MKEQYITALPKRSIGKALGYSIERWEKLSLYTENGMQNIDNNPVENSIRPVRWSEKTISLRDRMKQPGAAECFIACWALAKCMDSNHTHGLKTCCRE